MITALKIATIPTLFFIIQQDFKERKVYWFLFPLLGILLSTIHFLSIELVEIFAYYIALNFLLISLVIIILYGITVGAFKKPFLNHSFGMGDLLFFYAFALGFSSLTFIILFTNSLLFALLLFWGLKKPLRWKTVPLAGLMGLFLLIILTLSIFIDNPSLHRF